MYTVLDTPRRKTEKGRIRKHISAFFRMLSGEDRVRKGIAFLDATYGPEWRGRINWDTLDMWSGLECVLGQLEGTYSAGVKKLNLTGEEAYRYGFILGSTIPSITRMWRRMAMPR